jgi:hypothetical protein
MYDASVDGADLETAEPAIVEGAEAAPVIAPAPIVV